jgi:hypothetical protein
MTLNIDHVISGKSIYHLHLFTNYQQDSSPLTASGIGAVGRSLGLHPLWYPLQLLGSDVKHL